MVYTPTTFLKNLLVVTQITQSPLNDKLKLKLHNIGVQHPFGTWE